MAIVTSLVMGCSAGPGPGGTTPTAGGPGRNDGAGGATEDDPGASLDREPTGTRVVLDSGAGRPVSVRVEVARAEPERTRGLMFRRHLDPDAGMIFLFERMEHQSFWMENTLIPLDMIFIADAMTVVGVVEDTTPRTRDAREVDGDSRYVLEVNAGFAREHGIGPGTRVTFVGFEAGPPEEEATDAP